MKVNELEIQRLKQMFKEGKTLDDLAELVNHIISIQNSNEGTKYRPVSNKQLKHYYANINDKYVNFEIPKKSGGVRVITAPDRVLKKIQRRINFLLALFFEPRNAAHGFIENKSIVSNAKIHVGKKFVLNVDLKDFFPSIHFGRIKAVLQMPTFGIRMQNINREEMNLETMNMLARFGLNADFAQIISNFCCYQSKLPQGAPTSPVITNLVSQRLDYKLVGLAKSYHCYYTRYADDITFSSNKNKFKEEFLEKLNTIIKDEGFILNDKKSRLQKRWQKQEVTGITVNEKLNLSRNYIRNVRAALYNWEYHGYEKANAKFASLYPQEKGFLRNKTIPPIESVLSGKILFMGMVRGKNDPIYMKYRIQLDKLLKEKQNARG